MKYWVARDECRGSGYEFFETEPMPQDGIYFSRDAMMSAVCWRKFSDIRLRPGQKCIVEMTDAMKFVEAK